jgi:pimeloyl-ACP methyl ester carboxylesterase/predicted glycosyltransferase
VTDTATRPAGTTEEWPDVRAREPDSSGYATTEDGLRLWYEVHGDGGPTIVLLPCNPISHSRLWKAQVHYLARHHRVIVYDGRGNGRSDHPDPDGVWEAGWWASDCLTVLDATDTGSAVLVGLCGDGVYPAAQIAASQPDRVLGIFAIAPGVPLLTPPHRNRGDALERWDEVVEDPQGWAKQNRRHIIEHQRDFLEFFFREMFPEPHSEKAIEDAVAFAMETTGEMLAVDDSDPVGGDREGIEAICRQVRCPVLVVQGSDDRCQPFSRGLAFAELTGAEHVTLEGVGHVPNVRHPVLINTMIHEFASRFVPPAPPRTWTPAAARPRRALLVSSPIGLGHAWRDVEIARELRRLEPELEIEWLAQPPLTTLLEACGERVHPASAQLAPEAAVVDARGRAHELHAFQMLRHLDEVFVANFMVFNDLVREQRFDLWIADEAWELDYFLHENPELKTAPYVWLTDFVGVKPMPDGGEREAFLAADTNAQMVEHVARNPRLRDRSIFVGDPDDIVPGTLGPGLPEIRAWTEERFRFPGYVTGFVPGRLEDREQLRAELGFGADERVCIVAPGGSAVCTDLLRRAAEAFPMARERVPGLRMILVTGPRIDPATLPAAEGLEVHGYVHELGRWLAAADLAVSHGGLSTTMELAANERPFIYFPLAQHFEQNVHVHHRLQRHGAGRRMDFAATSADDLAEAIAEEIGREVDYLPVPDDGAARAAAVIAELL